MSWWYETTEEERMKFDKSRIYGAVNADELKPGDKVIVGDSLRFLRQEVEGDGYIETLKEVLDESHLQRFKAKDGVEWGLAYLVERKENCTNCGEGKWDAEHKKILCDPVNCGNGNVIFRNHEIEVCEYYKPITKQKAEMPELISLGNGQYVEQKVEHKCEDCTTYELCVEAKKIYKDAPCPYYRAKPHYRPFRDTDELIKVWGEKEKKVWGYNWLDNKQPMPLIWVRYKGEAPNDVCLINGFNGDEPIRIGDCWMSLETLFYHWEFLDGSLCGVEE